MGTVCKLVPGDGEGCTAQPGCVYTAPSTRRVLHPYVLETNFNPDPSLYHQVRRQRRCLAPLSLPLASHLLCLDRYDIVLRGAFARSV